jgi:hypothetical protein
MRVLPGGKVAQGAHLRSIVGSLVIFAAIRRASSRVSSLAALTTIATSELSE